MLREDSAGVPGQRRSVCLVAGELDCDERHGGIGAYWWLTAQALARQGWTVHILYAGDRSAAEERARLLSTDIGFSALDDFRPPRCFDTPPLLPCESVDRSERVRFALEELHREHRFGIIEFAERGGLGFRAIQARRAGLALHDVVVLVKLHGSTQWLRELDGSFIRDENELQLDYCERYSFENADIQASMTPDRLDYAVSVGWNGKKPPGYFALDSSSSPLVTVAVPYFNMPAFLPAALASLAAQTWPRLEVVVVDDGSTDTAAIRIFEEQKERFSQFHFLRQDNAGIGATRNGVLREATGEYFVCMDADNIAHPEMIERFVGAMQRRLDCSALSCYYLAFRDENALKRGEFDHSYRPTGGPFVLGALRNVYGDANAVYRTADFQAVGGFEIDRDTSFEDWEAFVKLVRAGHRVDVIPEHLFFYRHHDRGFSRATSFQRNRQRVLRQFREADRLPLAERIALWSALAGFQQGQERLKGVLQSRRHRLADWLHHFASRVPLLPRLMRWLRGGSGSSVGQAVPDKAQPHQAMPGTHAPAIAGDQAESVSVAP